MNSIRKTKMARYLANTIVDYVCDEYEIDADENGWEYTENYLYEFMVNHCAPFDLEAVCNTIDYNIDCDNEDDTDTVKQICNHLYLYITYCYEHDAMKGYLNDWAY